MSGDAGPRKRNKDKRKQKKDSVDMPTINPKRLSLSDEEETLPGVHSGIENVQMHVQAKDHGVGMCAKIVFFTLMAILAGLVVLIVIENRGGSDLDTPLSESRFSDYLQGWVEENRQEDDHHDEPHFLDDHDHDEESDDHGGLEKGEPFPEEKDVSSPDEDAAEEQVLNAELNANSDGNEDDDDDDDDDDDNDTNQSEVDDQTDNDDVQNAEEQLNESETQANDEADNDDDDDDNNTEEVAQEEVVPENSEPVENQADDADQDNDDDDDVQEQDDFLDDNLPFEEEFDEDDDNSFEEIVDNDAGEEDLLQRIAEKEKLKEEQQTAEESAPTESSQIPADRGSQSYMEEISKFNEELQNN